MHIFLCFSRGLLIKTKPDLGIFDIWKDYSPVIIRPCCYIAGVDPGIDNILSMIRKGGSVFYFVSTTW